MEVTQKLSKDKERVEELPEGIESLIKKRYLWM